jgi:hypothetical protein
MNEGSEEKKVGKTRLGVFSARLTEPVFIEVEVA